MVKTSVIYIRTSTTEQTPELQLKNIKELNPTKEATILKEQESAFDDSKIRPKFEQLKKLITTRKIDSLYVWHLDRIYRNRKKLVEFFTLCNAHGVKIFSYNQQWLNEIARIPEPFNEIVNDLVIQILGWISEEESRTKGNRVRNAIRKTTKGTYSYNGNKWGRKAISKS